MVLGTIGTPIGSGTPLITVATPNDPYALPISLERWRQIMGFNPYHFWGQANTIVPVTSNCNTIVREFSWQNADAVGREDIREAIRAAGHRLKEYLGYRIGTYYVEKVVPYPRPVQVGLQYGAAIDAMGRTLAVNVGEGYLQAVGVRARTLLGSPSVVYSDANGDGVNDTATITQATTVTDVSEIAVYFVAADRLDSEAVGEKWRIEPAKVTITAGVATIICPSWIMARPVKLQGVVTEAIDPADTTLATNNFAQTVEVYRLFTDPDGITTDTSQAVLLWESDPPLWCSSISDSSVVFDTARHDPAAVGLAIGRASIRNKRLGEIAPAMVVYNATQEKFTAVNWNEYKQPKSVILRYLAGAERREVESQITYGGNWDTIVARLAAAELSRGICACDGANQPIYRWQFDRSRAAGANDEQYRISERDLNNPWGTSAGAIYAWKQVENLMITRAFSVG